MEPVECTTEDERLFQEWEKRQDVIILAKGSEEVLLLRNKLGKTWYRRTRTAREPINSPSFHLKHNNLQAEMRYYRRLGYQVRSGAPEAAKTNSNARNARPNRSNPRRNGRF